MSPLMGLCDKAAEDTTLAGIDKVNYMAMGILLSFIRINSFSWIAIWSNAIGETLTKVLPAQVWAGLTAAGKMMPALGFAMLLKVMLSKEYAIFMVLGFVLVAYGKLPLLAIAMVGIAAAVYDFHVSMKTKNNTGGMTDGI
ncbi:MAG: PTS sugar transporter subunit IIC [Romboutsia timonensis]